MASIHRDIPIDADPGDVWDAVRDFGAVHRRLAPGFVTDARREGDTRIVTFHNGTVAREQLVDCDDARRRLAYAISGQRVKHYSASVQVTADGEAGTRITWIVDVLPDDMAPYISGQMDLSILAMQKTLARSAKVAFGSGSDSHPRSWSGRVTASAFLDALGADGPAADRADKMGLYGRFVGSWELDVLQIARSGVQRRRKGEWHFGWALEGRAVQDVWIVPPRGELRRGDAAAHVNSYGTTLRVYDPGIDAWQIQWTDPVTRNFLHMIGRGQGDDIVQLGTGPDRTLIRWIFCDITPTSFRWRGESSAGQTAPWRLNVEFAARRVG